MADFFIYQRIDMLNGDHLGDSSSSNQIISTDYGKIDRNYNQVVTKQLANGFTKISKYHYAKSGSNLMYEFSRELVGRYRLENHKLWENDWLSIYGGDVFYSDLPQIEYVNNENRFDYVTGSGSDIEIFAKILEASDRITGSGGNDYIYSFRGDDVINPGRGDDYVNGGNGTDIVEFLGKRSEYTLGQATDPSGIQSVTDYSDPDSPQSIYLASVDRAFKVSGPDGNDTLVDVEKLKFKDGTYNIATGVFTEEDNSSSSGKSKGGKSKKNKRGKGKKSKR